MALKKIGQHTFLIMLACVLHLCVKAQTQIAVPNNVTLTVQYKDTINTPLPVIKTSFVTKQQAYEYINNLPQLLANKGFLVASVDSIWEINATIFIQLYVGTQYNWVQLRTYGFDKNILSKAGYTDKVFNNKPMNIAEVNRLKEQLLSIYENDGYPFASVYLDSVSINNNQITAVLMGNKGNIYKIDSIKNYGKLKLNAKFLQRYLNIINGSIYSREKLKEVDKRMLELPYAQTQQPSTLNMLGSGAILNLYVDNKKSSEASAIFGFLPDANNTGKLQITGDVNLDLKNVFGAGEGLLFKYQALQPKSPRLNVGYDKPFFLKSAFGLSTLFELFKKDSSFLQVNAQVGVQLNLGKNQVGKVFAQFQNTNLLLGGIDTNMIKQTKTLPTNIDVKATNAGITYEFNNTNYRYNPLSGFDVGITALTGLKSIQKNNDIISLKSNSFNYASLYDSIQLKTYQLRVKLFASKYFQLSKASTFKASLHGGLYSSPTIFRNEIFQIGGYKLLRGFDEESIYATQYAVLTAEYRSLLGLNSYFFGFVDYGSTKATYQNVKLSNNFVSTGLGIAYETKAGLLNLSLALGKRNDIPFNIRQAAKIHFGYVNYF
ncbi:ShlB/FhaC/HecB family hemolysin secretion/activation protein [Ferruginibacter yonginensis]|uniref:ShlB/FhaC/HecB family hemolysin secretion/activation protein n=1 Tax=Ferruginibacter yonginensis TaxID=1310416 RepID=A0ABV8QRM5_9BACT